jgi:hypothetical protein
MNPSCEACGSKKKLEVHHLIPFHLAPDLELDPSNLMTLCDGGGKYGMKSCHLFFGHGGAWQRFNPVCKMDIIYFKTRRRGLK